MKCSQCFRKSDLYLCGPCQSQLRTMLMELPWWYEALTDTALKRTRGGDGGQVPHGDSQPALFAKDADEKKNGRQTKQGQASDLMSAIRNMLTTTVRDMCEQRGVLVPFGGREATCARVCQYLAAHVASIASDEGAGDTWREIRDAKEKIERVVNPPEGRKFVGSCPTRRAGNDDPCGLKLYAPRDATEVYCPHCRITHNCDWLQKVTWDEMQDKPTDISGILKINRLAPEEFRVAPRTLQRWRESSPSGAPARLQPCEYANGEPLYRYRDVAELRAEKKASA